MNRYQLCKAVSRGLLLVFSIIIGAFFALPLLWLLTAPFSTQANLSVTIPEQFSANFKTVFNNRFAIRPPRGQQHDYWWRRDDPGASTPRWRRMGCRARASLVEHPGVRPNPVPPARAARRRWSRCFADLNLGLIDTYLGVIR